MTDEYNIVPYYTYDACWAGTIALCGRPKDISRNDGLCSFHGEQEDLIENLGKKGYEEYLKEKFRVKENDR